MEPINDNQLDRFDSDTTSISTSTSTSFTSSILTSSSGDLSSTSASSSSGEIPPLLVSSESVPTLVIPESEDVLEIEDLTVTVTEGARRKCVGRDNKGVTWGVRSIIGRRREMEDAVKVVPGFMSGTCGHVGGCLAAGSRTSGAVSPVHFFGVFDGHGGSQVAKYCERRMHEVIAEEWNRGEIDADQWQRRWEAAFSSSFERTDDEVMTAVVAPEMVGSTAIVVVLSGCQIITSNCGDSRAVLCRGTETIPLTIDQKPDRPDELTRIEGGGGRVINWNGARVFGVLAMSRAIGDRYLRPWIIPVPEITFTARRDDDECLVLASDGLWDVMNNDEVGEITRRLIRRRRKLLLTDETSPAQGVADYLTELATARNSSDNISIIVVDLKTKKKHRQRTAEG